MLTGSGGFFGWNYDGYLNKTKCGLSARHIHGLENSKIMDKCKCKDEIKEGTI